jgi:hypothetical protein
VLNRERRNLKLSGGVSRTRHLVRLSACHEKAPRLFPTELARQLPKYPNVPAALLGRLAINSRYRGQRLGVAAGEHPTHGRALLLVLAVRPRECTCPRAKHHTKRATPKPT